MRKFEDMELIALINLLESLPYHRTWVRLIQHGFERANGEVGVALCISRVGKSAE